MADLPTLVQRVHLDGSGFQAGANLITGSMGEAEGGVAKFASTAAIAGVAAVAAIGAAAVGIGFAAFKIGEDFKSGFDKIRTGTGETGAALDGLKDSAKNVFSTVPESFGNVSTTITKYHQILGETGKPLEDISRQTLQLSHITGTDLKGNVDNIAGAFKQWQIPTDQQATKLNELFRVSQQTGIGVDVLTGVMSKQGATLRNAGFDYEHAASLIGLLEKNAIPVGPVMMGMNKAVGGFMKAGEDPRAKMQELLKNIRDMPDATKAGELAMQTFGARGGPKLAEALRSGQLSVDDLANRITKGGDTIGKATHDTENFSEKFDIMKNKLLVAVEPVTTAFYNMFGKGMDLISEKGGVIDKVQGGLQDLFGKVTGGGKKPVVMVDGKVVEDKSSLEQFRDHLSSVIGGGWLAGWGGVIPAAQHAFHKIVEGAEEYIGSIKRLIFSINWADVIDTIRSIWNDIGPTVAHYLEMWSSGFRAVYIIAARIIDVIRILWDLFGDDILQYVREAFHALADVIGGVMEVFQGFFDIISGLFSGDWSLLWQGVQEVFGGVWLAMQGIVEAVWAEIHFYISYAVEVLLDLFSPLIDFVWNILSPVWDFVRAAVQIAFDLIVLYIQTWWDIASAIFYTVYDFITNTLAPLWEFLRAAIQVAFDFIVLYVTTWWDIASAIFYGIVDFVSNVLVPIWEWLRAAFMVAWDAIGGAISFYWGLLSGIFFGIVDFVGGVLSAVWGGLVGAVSGAWNFIVGAVSGAWSALSGIFWTVVGFVQDTLGHAFSVFGDVAKGAWDGLKDAAMGALHVLGLTLKPLKAILDALSNVPLIGQYVGDAAGALGNFIGAVGAESGAEMGRVGPGFVTNGPRYLVGEGDPNHPEFVVPTDPKHRQNAMRLVASLLQTIGLPEQLSGTPLIGLASGGSMAGAVDWISHMKDLLGDIVSKIPGVGGVIGAISDFFGSNQQTPAEKKAFANPQGGALPGGFGGGKDYLHAAGGVLYDSGGILPPGITTAVNLTGQNEMVLKPGDGGLGTQSNPLATQVQADSGLQDLGTVWADQLTSAAATVGPDVATGMQGLIDQSIPLMTDFGAQTTQSMADTTATLTSTMTDALATMTTTQQTNLQQQLDQQTASQQTMTDQTQTFYQGVVDTSTVGMDTTNVVVASGWNTMQTNTQSSMTTTSGIIGDTMNGVVLTMTTGAQTAATSFVDQLNAKIPPLQYTLAAYAESVKQYGRDYLTQIGAPVPFAEGGIAEDHNPHFAYTQRTYGEPETGGEAYIPLAEAKRPRSTDLLSQVAKMFGFGLMPRRFADGGFNLEELFWEAGDGTDWKNGVDIGRTIGGHADHVHAGTTGAPWEAVQSFLEALGLNPRPTSTFRPGDGGSLHALGRAVDYGNSINDVSSIYHALLATLGVGGGSGGSASIPEPAVPGPPQFGPGIPAYQASVMADIMQISMQKKLEDIRQIMLASRGGGPLGAATGELADWIHAGMQRAGVGEDWYGDLLSGAMRESGGNPLAVNRNDSNWQAGIPSQGLMQIVPPTWNRWTIDRPVPPTGIAPPDADIWNPISSVTTAIKYIQGSYGGNHGVLAHAYGHGGITIGGIPVFDDGGILAPGLNMILNTLGQPEPLSPSGVNPYGVGQPNTYMPFGAVSSAAGALARNSGQQSFFNIGPEQLADVSFTDAMTGIFGAAIQSNPDLKAAFADPEVQAQLAGLQETVAQYLRDNPSDAAMLDQVVAQLNKRAATDEELRATLRDYSGITVEAMNITSLDPAEIAQAIVEEISFQRITAGM